LAASVKKRNEAFVSFAALQKDAFKKTEVHVLATNQGDWNRLQKAVQDAETEFAAAQTDKKSCWRYHCLTSASPQHTDFP
jgi:hypothetical protein